MSDYKSIPAKKTLYKGIQFRSRLEARWALFFDYLHIPYEYEPQQFRLEHRKYTPDFTFNPTLFIEIKPSSVPLLTLKKGHALATQHQIDFYLFGGDFYEYPAIQIVKIDRMGRISFDYDFRGCPVCNTTKLDNVGKCRVCNTELVEYDLLKEKVKYYTFTGKK